MSIALRNQFADFVSDFKARMTAQRPQRQAPAPAPAPAPFDIEAARAKLARLEASFDPSYHFTEDREQFRRGTARAAEIDGLRADIARHEQLQRSKA